ncbi:MAG: tetratricopeptide repeat protein [Pseudomonadota bacterium]
MSGTPLPSVLLATALAAVLAACGSSRPPAAETAGRSTDVPLLQGLGETHRDIGTRVPEAQQYFDQGLRLAYGFNHEAAGRAFAEAARRDPDCAICVWGQALVLGPNINLPMDPASAAEATALAALAPGSGHLVHMPAHAYIRLGRYHDATLANFAAADADRAFLAVCRGSNGVYPLGYVPHNWHFATMTAGLTGSRTLALQAAQQTARRADHAAMGAPPMEFMQLFVVAPLLTQVRFGDWSGILATPAATPDLPFPRAIRHFARGMAYVRGGQLAEAGREADALHALAQDPALENVAFFDINTAAAILKVADPLLRGEWLRAQGRQAEALASLRAAAKAEAALNYNEPADWPLPVRWYLGAALLEAGDATAAAQAYREDLQAYPENGWSLFGLAQAQRALGDSAGAADSQRRQAIAWQWADAPLTASRY